MTTEQVLLFCGGYLVELVAVVWFTRATLRRILAALAGAAVVGAFALWAIAFCKAHGWWRIPFGASPSFVPLLYLTLLVSSAPLYLVTWRVARRFGWRGLAVCLAIAAVVGPPRDEFIAAMFPRWMVFSPGLAPIVADSVAYVGMVGIGHAVMRLLAGPSGADRLARTPRAAV